MTNSFDFPPAILDRLKRTRMIAVLIVDEVQDAIPVAQALLAGGIEAMELTLRTAGAVDAIRRIKGEVPGMIVGAGTVLTPEQVLAVADARADFAVAPGTNARVVRAARERGLPFAPGIATPSDIEQALELGCRLLKFFPAEPMGGLGYLKSIAAPYAHLGVKYIPLGSVDMNCAAAYLNDPMVQAVGGSWIAPRDLIVKREWGAIEQNARKAVSAVGRK
ncbi:MAG TPA: bifunctional 4-hydroxy-2-oxoglutarate aldolase/2-dehydro-3-deoxy-phosphogluconate aldolase [Tepidisphaeraceae bacterium]|jgi:2-dehydro-3-deoxyphosphogluconate aldolase/(4S)-4-hydroxy-2-oxoglutarate aldolase|nr:bifunctional 4-hydroxy-2-oxoglutarate aldolase/2-dehydro-3-deoxy-phosphogluconate aldolase [Tepidisphaeraceae bacterium]